MLPAYELISDAINKALGSDTANKRYLTSLGNVRIRIDSEAPDTSLIIYINEGSVVLQSLPDSDFEKADIRISGKAVSIAKLLLQPNENVSELRRSGIHIEGDITLLLELTRISKQLEIDWEALLADNIGETPAVILGKGLNQAKMASRDLLALQKKALEGLVTNNNAFVPTRNEFEQMKTGVRDIHYRLDRLEAILRQSNVAPTQHEGNR